MLINRRQLLQGLGALGLSQLLWGCQSGAANTLNVYMLKGSLPPQLIDRFRSQAKLPLTLKPQGQLSDLFQQLKDWQQQAQKQAKEKNKQQAQTQAQNNPAPPRLLSLGDYWLVPAIQQGLIEPLDPQRLQKWQTLPERWQALGRRDRTGQLSASGDLWGAPYRYGGTLVVYRRDKFKPLGWTPTDWSDLWRPELQQRISLPDQAREVIGLTLKSLKQSYNIDDLDSITALAEQLNTLNQQVKFYSSTHYLQPLILGDTWLAVGWSSDILPLLQREPDLQALVPASGTALWADLWVQAKGTAPSSNSQAQPAQQPNKPKKPIPVEPWIDFWWQADIAQQLSQFTSALSPALTTPLPPPDRLEQSLAAPEILAKSEFLLPLSSATVAQYQRLWTQMRQRV